MTISTAGMIEAVRTAAGMTKTQEEKDCLNSIANRIDILTEANAGMDLQLNSIRTALNIPVNTSVQAGVIAETSRLNDEVLSLRSELSESVAQANKLRRTAKECQEENQQLRTELAELQDRPADAEIQCMEDMSLRVINVRDGFTLGRWPVFTRAVPPTASQIVPDEVALLADQATIVECSLDELGVGAGCYADNPQMKLWGRVYEYAEAASQPHTVPDEWSLNRAWEIDGLDKMTVHQAHRAGYEQCRAAMLAVAPKLDRKDGDA